MIFLKLHNKIEVACFMSKQSDMAEIEEDC